MDVMKFVSNPKWRTQIESLGSGELRRILENEWEQRAERRKLHYEEAYNLYSPETTTVIDLRSVRLAAHVVLKAVIKKYVQNFGRNT